MDLNSAIKNRILQLLHEHDMSIYKLSMVCAMPPSSIKIFYTEKVKVPKLSRSN